MNVDLIVIGAGPAGLAAAIEAKKAGVDDVIVLERDREPGGILQQCIHNGFGLHVFNEEMTGPEYAYRFIEECKKLNIKIYINTMVLSINENKEVATINPIDGLVKYSAKAIILSMGCRERTRGALRIPGSRPSGVMTAGTAQRFVNLEGYLPGKEVVILGSGDIGLIMARRMTLEGAKVKMVCEIMPYSGGLNRNIVQCLEDYDIPLRLNTTVVKIHGNERVEAVTIAQVDGNRKPIQETFETVSCDTLLLSVGLIPENELSLGAGIVMDPVTQGPIVDHTRETSISGIFACGNVVHVHDLVDYVTDEARIAGKYAAKRILKEQSCEIQKSEMVVQVIPRVGVRYIVPQIINMSNINSNIDIFFRVDNLYNDRSIKMMAGERTIMKKKRKKLAPGEMEKIIISQKDLLNCKNTDTIEISVE